MFWVYDHYKCFTLPVRRSTLQSESDDYGRLILTSKVIHVGFWHLQSLPVLLGLNKCASKLGKNRIYHVNQRFHLLYSKARLLEVAYLRPRAAKPCCREDERVLFAGNPQYYDTHISGEDHSSLLIVSDSSCVFDCLAKCYLRSTWEVLAYFAGSHIDECVTFKIAWTEA